MGRMLIAETDAYRLLKRGAITLHGRVGDTRIVIERTVPGGYEAFLDTEDWPPQRVGVFKWGEFELTEVRLIVWDEAMTLEEFRERLEMWRLLNTPEQD